MTIIQVSQAWTDDAHKTS